MFDEATAVGNARRREIVDLAVKGERLVVEGEFDDLHRLVELLAIELVGRGLVRVVHAPDRGAQRLGLARHGPPPHAEDAPPLGDVVEGGEVLGQLQRVPLGHDVEGHADAKPFGALGQDCADEDAVGDDLVALVLKVVLGEPERVEAGLLGCHPHVDDALGGFPHLLVAVAP